MKTLLFSIITLCTISGICQPKASAGSPDEFKLSKNPKISSFSGSKEDYFVLTRIENMLTKQSLIASDKGGNIKEVNEVEMNNGTFNDIYEIKSVQMVNDKLYAFIENQNKTAGKNKMSCKVMTHTGTLLSNTEITVGSFDYQKRGNAGSWYITETPDKKHIAVVAQLPHEKDMPPKFAYYFFDENMKQINTGQFSFAGYTKEVYVWNFLASDKGDFYLIAQETEKSFPYPVIYKAAVGNAAGTIIPVKITEPKLVNFTYTSAVNNAGELVIAGYTQQKSIFSATDEATIKAVTKGIWLFNSSKPAEVKTIMFDKPIENMTARRIIFNGSTFFLVGEQFSAVKERTTGSMNFEENYNYIHKDILVTGFDNEGNKKFEMPLNRNWTTRNFEAPYHFAAGLLNGKLTIVYNDHTNKYIAEKPTDNSPIPVLVSITNDGLMEAPVQYSKEMEKTETRFTVYPMFTVFDNSHINLLAGNDTEIMGLSLR